MFSKVKRKENSVAFSLPPYTLPPKYTGTFEPDAYGWQGNCRMLIERKILVQCWHSGKLYYPTRGNSCGHTRFS